MHRFKNFLLILVAFIAGTFVSLFATLALAHGGDTNLVHACVRTTLPNLPNIRIVGANDNCNANETALDWPKTGNTGSNTVFTCVYCTATEVMRRINQSSLTNYNFDNGLFGENDWGNADFSGSSFVYAVLKGVYFGNSAGVNTDFSNADMRVVSIQQATFTNAKFINTNLASGSLNNSNFTNADFTNADLSNAFLNDSTVNGANFTGVIWDNTYCPDGTNSNDHGNTCEGHLTP